MDLPNMVQCREHQEISKVQQETWKPLHNRNDLHNISGLYYPQLTGYRLFYDYTTLITVVALDCFTVEFSEVRLHNADRP